MAGPIAATPTEVAAAVVTKLRREILGESFVSSFNWMEIGRFMVIPF